MIPPEHNEKKHRFAYAWPVFLLVVVGFFPFTLGGHPAKPDPAFRPDKARPHNKVEILQQVEESPDMALIPHTPVPDEVRGIYWTAVTAGSSRSEELLDYMRETGLNTVVIDTKMDDGQLAFAPRDVSMQRYAMDTPAIADLDALLTRLHDHDIYRIARIPVMRDGAFARVHPELAMKSLSGKLWQDNIGSYWIDPAAPEVADYAIALAREAYARGFDEVQFDYVRFASDGSVNSIVYPVYDRTQSKGEVMQGFFKTVGSMMKAESIPVSFDLFGMTYWSYEDFGIGQRLVDVFPYSDWTSAMVYPSHFPDGFKGIASPALEPYWIVNESMQQGCKFVAGTYAGDDAALRRTFRPWLQDFDIGAVYTPHLIEEQIRATRDAGASGWLLWNARNVYERADYQKIE